MLMMSRAPTEQRWVRWMKMGCFIYDRVVLTEKTAEVMLTRVFVRKWLNAFGGRTPRLRSSVC